MCVILWYQLDIINQPVHVTHFYAIAIGLSSAASSSAVVYKYNFVCSMHADAESGEGYDMTQLFMLQQPRLAYDTHMDIC